MFTNFCIKTYRYFSAHKGIYVALLVALFGFFGYFGMQIRLEEDLGKLMPSSRNPDGTTKLAFANLKVKDITYILFESDKPESAIACCDAFMDSLQARDEARIAEGKPSMVGNLFYNVDLEELMGNGITYLMEHLPAYVDTSFYASLDTMLTRQYMTAQMQRNQRDFDSEFGEFYSDILERDPIGLRTALASNFLPLIGEMGGSKAEQSNADTPDEQAKKTGYAMIDGHIFAADSSFCIAFITPKASANNTGQSAAFFDCINELKAQSPADVKIWYHGTPASGYYNSHTIKHDLMYTVGGGFLLVLLVLVFCFRRLRTIPLMALPVIFGTLFALSMMYFFVGEFSLLALAIGGVILGVALSYSLHILVHQTYVGDPERVLRDETKPILLGCVTTIGSFLGLMFVHTDLLRDFGIFASLAIVGTTLFSLLMMPMLLPRKAKDMAHIVDRVSSFKADRSKLLLGIIGTLTAVCIGAFCYGGVHFDEDMGHLGKEFDHILHSEELLKEKTSSADRSKFFAASGDTMEEAIANYQVLTQKLDSLQALGYVKSYSHKSEVFVPLTVQQERIDAWHAYWTPERQALLRSLIAETAPHADLNAEAFDPFFDEMIDGEFEPDALYDTDLIPAGYLATMMERSANGEYLSFTSVICESDHGRAFEDTEYAQICYAIADLPHMMVLDTYYYTRDSLKQLNADFSTLQWISLAFVLVVLFFSFRYNVRHSLLGFMPIIVSWFIVLGAMFLFGRSFNLINIIISTFIFGVGVDYSIFVMNGLVSGEEDKLRHHRAAILLSAVILIITVGSMALADHPAVQSVGFSTLVGLIAAIVLAWIVQPAVFRIISRKKQ